MGRIQKRFCLVLFVVALFSLSGCLVQSADDLYALPRQSDAYYDLQNAIDSVKSADAAYAGPLSGPNQQAVQLADLDGDGTDEALVFMRTSGEKPLKVYVFDDKDGSFALATVIEGDGTAFDAVEYVSIDDQPGLEIVLGRQLSNQILQSLSVYSYGSGRMVELMNTSYSEYKITDLNVDDQRDVLILRRDAEARTGVAEYYCYSDGAMTRTQSAALSRDIESIERITTGYVSAEVPGVFVTSTYGEESGNLGEGTLITDVLAFRGQTFCNLTVSAQSGISTQMVRSMSVYATDIDDDGLVELPTLVALPSASAEASYFLVQWYELKPDGTREKKPTTYYNYSYGGGWYLVIPEAWEDQLTISRTTEVAGIYRYTFSRWIDREVEPQEILSIYTISGEDRHSLAQSDGRFLLSERGETVYAASLGESSLSRTISEEKVKTMFSLILDDWNSGET